MEPVTVVNDVVPAVQSCLLSSNNTLALGCVGAFAAAKAITILTKTPTDDSWFAKIYKWIEVIALVIGRAKK
jgi:hypothetical protein